MTAARTKKIAALNDELRQQLNLLMTAEPTVPGTAVMTAGISALPLKTQLDIWQRVRSFDDFTADNDPYGEHDFGAFTHPNAGKVFWKIDCYADASCTWGAEHPDDPARSYRVLTVMLAREY